MQPYALVSVFIAAILGPASGQAVINVPAHAPTIQAAIDMANLGDTVVISPGLYFETINFTGKDITVRSSNGRAVTIIDGNFGPLPVVSFVSGETAAAVLEDLTIASGHGSGILIDQSGPTIRGCMVTQNRGVNGGGINVLGASSARIEDSTIANNEATNSGGGLYVANGGGSVTVNRCIVQANVAVGPTGSAGGGVRRR